ncbi:NYN domain-containing protein [Thermosynechococcaceae cyanobacterium BACA0444]|uniref:NYN domain-containing protein n=1 Tax=Pseudocalidococcus azoricus BACA0444 TaxID=2918990 RepID=A0AAE4JUM3_9CYAN|nr:NYN domain-containing protein [Pseudocalidococcus azoricus]MDS3859500.1 NYN domain-containing protein [Pseudocalidococcus azoricus BACA0444]
MNLFRSPTQSWLIITLSTLAAGTISTLALTLKDPVAIIFSSGLGALGSSAITQSRKQEESTPKDRPSQATDPNGIEPGRVTLVHGNPVAPEIPPQQGTISKLKTVILFDIENLTEGYKNRNGHIYRVSIKDILDRITAVEIVGEIVGQYAYADWSNDALKSIRQQISQLGIKPEQFINFEHDIKKNATDIQLSVDAIHLVHQNPIIECVVIVSGDGGFASLAEKLRWYGKVLVGCAYDNSASKKLQAMCHHFIQIPYPVDQRQRNPVSPNGEVLSSSPPRPILRSQNRTSEAAAETITNLSPDSQEAPPKTADLELPPLPPTPLNGTNLTDPTGDPQLPLKPRRRRKRTGAKTSEPSNASPTPSSRKAMVVFADGLVAQLSPLTSREPIEAARKIQELLNAYFYLSPKSQTFQAEGIFPSLVEPIIYAIIPHLKQIFLPLGIVRFNEYLRFACQDSEFCLARAGNCLKLFCRSYIPEPFSLEPDVIPKPLHHPDTYRQILATDFGELFNTNGDLFQENLPSASILAIIGQALLELRPSHQDMNTFLHQIQLPPDLQASDNEIRRSLYVWRAAGVLKIDAELPNIRLISLSSEINSRFDLHQALLNTLHAKLTAILATISETINGEVLDSLLFSLEI